MSLSKVQVKKEIQKEVINGVVIHYSYAEKSQANISVFKNDRLLIFNQFSGSLYYINEPKVLPFVSEIPKPKNQWADINISIVKNTPGTNELHVEFVMKNEQTKTETPHVWDFYLETPAMAKKWHQIIQEFKNRKINQILQQGNQGRQKPQTNTAFIHDTLGFGYMDGIRQKPNDGNDLKRSVTRPLNTSNVKPSTSLQNSRLKPPPAHSASNVVDSGRSPQKPPSPNPTPSNSNIRNRTSVNATQSNIKPVASNDLNRSILKPSSIQPQNMRNSNARGNTLGESQVHRNSNNAAAFESPQRGSKVTLRDELQSIMERSRLSQSRFSTIGDHAQGNTNIGGNRLDNVPAYNRVNDWNLKFLRKPEQSTLLQFQKHAEKLFMSLNENDKTSNKPLRQYEKDETLVSIANAQTQQSARLKSEFRNYHFIMQSCKGQFIVGVPLSVLIEFQGSVALVKSAIPRQAEQLQLSQEISYELKDLERYTRIKNGILKKAKLFDLSDLYDIGGTTNLKRVVYIDELHQYLPVHLQQNFKGGLMRPEHVLDNVNYFMQGGVPVEANKNDMKLLNETLQSIKYNVKEFAKQLSNQDIQFANCEELKNIMHLRGLNLKYLPMLYSEVTNKNVKKYLNTIMVAKVAKDNLLETISQVKSDPGVSLTKTVEDTFRLLIEGNNSVSNEFWKQIALGFRKQYAISMSNHDIIGGFLLNCLMKLIPAQYDVSKINDQKIFFKDQGIILKGFVVKINAKIKTYYRYTTELTDKIDAVCKQQKCKQHFEIIIDELELRSKPIPENFVLSGLDKRLKEYLTFYVPPDEHEKGTFTHLKLYQPLNQEPPTQISLTITKNYLQSCLDHQQNDTFKQTLENTLSQIDYWYDKNHPFHCEFYESLSNYYGMIGKVEENINFMKESLAICIRNGGITSKKTGSKYYELAQKELRAGRKSDSLENFLKAKNNMESTGQKGVSYPITLMKLASLYLNSSDFDNCVIYSKNAVERFEDLEKIHKSVLNTSQSRNGGGIYDQYCIKSVQIMTRAFEIQGKKQNFIKAVQSCTSKFNRTKKPSVFQQLIKICLTGLIFKHSLEKCQLFQSFIEKQITGMKISQEPQQPAKCIEELMALAQQFNVMERFMIKFESLERIVSDINSRRALTIDSKEFINITKNIVGCVGQDYIYGLCQQKQFE